MTALRPSVDNFIAQSTAKGPYVRLCDLWFGGTAKTAATLTSGEVIAQRSQTPMTLPSSFGSGVTGLIPTAIQLVSAINGTLVIVGLEVTLGTMLLTSSGTFTAGSAMPSRRQVGSDTATPLATMMPVVAITPAFNTGTWTSPSVTITYTNQDGVTGRTATLALPSNPTADSAFMVAPHLQSGDTGIREVTNMTRSVNASTAGATLGVYGVYPLQVFPNSQVPVVTPDLWSTPLPKIVLQPSDTIGGYLLGTTTSNASVPMIFSGVADT